MQPTEGVTQLLVKWSDGDEAALEGLMPLVYSEPDGKQVVFSSSKDKTMNTWVVQIEGGGPPKQLTFDTEQLGWGFWSPDGKLLSLKLKRGANIGKGEEIKVSAIRL